MPKGIPLDDYLNSTGIGLSDEEMDRQLFPAMPEPGPRSKSTPSKQTTKSVDVEQLLSDAMTRIADQEEAQDAIDSSVKAASHGVKVLAPLLAAATKWANPESEPEKLNDLMGKVLGRVRSDAHLVIEAYGVSANDSPPWLTSQVSGQIMSLLVAALERNNGAILDPSDSRYLQPLINMAKSSKDISESFYNKPSDANWQLINALTMATADVMAEYHAFDYFHSDAAGVAAQISEYLDERVLQGTLTSLTERFGLKDSEQAYLGTSLIRQAGKTLAEAWASSIPQTLSVVKGLEKEQRRDLLVTGCPLDEVFNNFEKVYQGLEISALSALRTLSPGREIDQGKKHGQSLV